MNRTKFWFTLLIFATWLLGMGSTCTAHHPMSPSMQPGEVNANLLLSPATPRPDEPIAIRGTTFADGALHVGGVVAIYRGTSRENLKRGYTPMDPDQVGVAFNYSSPGTTGSVDFNVRLPEGDYTAYVFAEGTFGDIDRPRPSLELVDFVVSDCGPPPSVRGQPILSLQRGEDENGDRQADAIIDLGILPLGTTGPIPLGISGGVPPLRLRGDSSFDSVTATGELLIDPTHSLNRVRKSRRFLIDSCSPPREFLIEVRYTIGSDSCLKPAPRFDAARLVPGSISLPLNFQLAAVGGEPPLTYGVLPGSSLPPGLSLDGDRVVGTPTQVGEFDTAFTATDSCATPRTTSATFHFEIAGAGICPPMAAGAWTGVIAILAETYSHQVIVVGGAPPITVATNASTEFPPGLSLNGDRIEGTPTQGGSYSVNLTAEDECNAPFELILPIEVGCAPLAITTAALPNAIVGQPYSQIIATSGGLAPVTLTQVDGILPTGLVFTGNSISGTATAAATRVLRFRATDSCSPPQTIERELTIVSASSCPPIVFDAVPLADGDIGAAYSVQLFASGGQAPLGFSVRPGDALPPGLTLSQQGTINGVPTANGVFTFSVLVTDSCTPPQVRETNLQIRIGDNECGGTLNFTSESVLPTGTVNVPYTATIEVTGGVPPYRFFVDDPGDLPMGLTMSNSGVIFGTPTQAVAADFVGVRVTDSCASEPLTVFGTFVITIVGDCPALSLDTTSLPAGIMGVPYSFQLLASGGVPPRTFARFATSGPLPPGLTLSSSGLISGTPTTVGTLNVTLQVTDMCSPPQISTRQLSIQILEPGSCPTLALMTHPLPNVTAFVPYESPITATGGMGPLLFTLISGTLPPGLGLGTDGVIRGQVFEVGTTYNFGVQAQDGCSPPQTVSAVFTLKISCNALNITSTTLPGSPLNAAYNYQLQTTGGDPPISFALTGGSLPTGLALSSSGIISGTASAAGTFNFTVEAMDGCATGVQTDSQALSITVSTSACPPIQVVEPTPPTGFPGKPYSYQFSATGGFGAIRYRVGSGTLPSGLSLDEMTGLLSGTTNQGGNFFVDIVFYDLCNPVQEVTRSVLIHII